MGQHQERDGRPEGGGQTAAGHGGRERDSHRAGRPCVRLRVVARETPKSCVADDGADGLRGGEVGDGNGLLPQEGRAQPAGAQRRRQAWRHVGHAVERSLASQGRGVAAAPGEDAVG
jgi:hypothetical protein